jgi:hypothetical protein
MCAISCGTFPWLTSWCSTAEMETWVGGRTVKELKTLMTAKGLSWTGLERRNIEDMIAQSFSTVEEANDALLSAVDEEMLKKLGEILSQDRHVVDYRSYETSEEHRLRISTRPSRMNIDREDWFKHPNYSSRPQMPPYHVHFREEMQLVLSLLLSWFQNSSSQTFNKAFRVFRDSMEGLHGHVRIEERAFFPQIQAAHPAFDLGFLYQDHQILHNAEDNLKRKFEKVAKSQENPVTPQEQLSLLRLALEFDELLINHLGEEEEIVVPLCLL